MKIKKSKIYYYVLLEMLFIGIISGNNSGPIVKSPYVPSGSRIAEEIDSSNLFNSMSSGGDRLMITKKEFIGKLKNLPSCVKKMLVFGNDQEFFLEEDGYEQNDLDFVFSKYIDSLILSIPEDAFLSEKDMSPGKRSSRAKKGYSSYSSLAGLAAKDSIFLEVPIEDRYQEQERKFISGIDSYSIKNLNPIITGIEV